MSATLAVLDFGDYGYVELKRIYQKFMRKAFVVASVGHLIAATVYLTAVWATREPERVLPVRLIKYADLGPPPSLASQQAAPQIQVAGAAARPTIGIPEPVPDAEVSSETTIATQTEMSQMTSLVGGEGVGEGAVIQVEQPVAQEADIVVEEEPVAVEQPKPVYPEIARRAGIEGTVWVMILVDKTGKVRDVQITKGPEMFHEAAREAAWKSVWKPAIQNHKPVAVWVTYPVRFTLK